LGIIDFHYAAEWGKLTARIDQSGTGVANDLEVLRPRD
jgi:hypothetical protein